jgi:hypothetical protein
VRAPAEGKEQSMIRNLKVLMAAATALTAFAALGASGAQGAEFHCSVAPCQVTMKPDGTGTTAHHVITLIGGFSTTCKTVTGEATLSSKTSSEITISNIQGEGCSFLGQPSTLKSNGCHYLLGSGGTLTVTCPEGKELENNGFNCNYNIPAQGPLKGVSYHNVGSEVTMEMKVKLKVSTFGVGCPSYPSEAEFTTGNTLLTGETDPGGIMSTFWWE